MNKQTHTHAQKLSPACCRYTFNIQYLNPYILQTCHSLTFWHQAITNIGDYPKGLLVFFIENVWYSENGRDEEAGYQSLHLKNN